MVKKVEAFLFHLAEYISVACLIIMVALEVIVVTGRYCFSYTPPWGEEFALFFMTWLGLVSAAISERTKSHIRVSIIDTVYPPVLLRIFGVLRYFSKLFFIGAMLFFCTKLALTTRNMFSSVPLSKGLLFIAGSAAGAIMLVFCLMRIKQELTDTYRRTSEEIAEDRMEGILNSND